MVNIILIVNVGEDCPVFDGLFEYCRLYTAGSIGGAVRLNEQTCGFAFKSSFHPKPHSQFHFWFILHRHCHQLEWRVTSCKEI